MTDEQLLAWGRVEDTMRKQDIAEAKASGDLPAGLRSAQDAAVQRRRAAGLSADQAMRAVRMAQRAAA